MPFRKVADEFFKNRKHGVVALADTEENFVFGVVLTAETGEVLVCLVVKSSDWLQVAYRRREIRLARVFVSGAPEESPRAVKRDQIVEQRKRRYDEENACSHGQKHRTCFRQDCWVLPISPLVLTVKFWPASTLTMNRNFRVSGILLLGQMR